jgi:hypothetical protein
MGALLVLSTLTLFNADFGVCTNSNQEYYPTAVYGSNQYQVFWTDYRYSPVYSLFGARVTTSGTVVDVNGKSLFQDSVFNPRAAFDGTNTMVVWREGC